jgi:dihydroorotate dehydrogenase (NAD+) catalytic subunit
MTRTLAVDLGGLILPSPVVVASGCAGTGRELAAFIDAKRIGAVVSRSVTLAPRKGSATPRVAETPSGVIWDTGLQNPGIEAFISEELPRLVRYGAPVIVSIAGGSLEEFVRLTTLLQKRTGVVAIETRISGPDEELERPVLASRSDRAAEVVGAVARMSSVPVFAKLPPLLPDIVETASAVVRAGAHGLTLVDSAPALGVQAERLRPELGEITGGLSGPALRPIALRAVLEVTRALPDTPVFGCGGVRSARDAIEMILAGAWAVQVGTAVLVDPHSPVAILHGIADGLKALGLPEPSSLRGKMRLPSRAEA